MSKEKYNVIIDDSIDYTITVKEKKDNTSYTFKRSKSDTWLPNAKGVTIIKAIDDGNGVDIDIKEFEGTYVGYDILFELKVLLDFIHDSAKGVKETYKIVKNNYGK
jgi:adenine-specific DNA methylase